MSQRAVHPLALFVILTAFTVLVHSRLNVPVRSDHRHEGDHPLILGPSPVEAAALDPGEVVVEYIAHACFRIFGPDGTVLLIDPYADRRWIPLDLPIGALSGAALDAILITHPHYDHDAGRFVGRPFPFPAEVPVLIDSGVQRIGEFEITGILGKHAEPYGKEFGQINTAFVVEIDGLRIAHVGDNGPLSTRTARGLTDIDVLMMPIDGHEHLLSFDEVDEMIRTVSPRVVVPMHYEHPDLGETSSLGPIDPWLEGRSDVRRLAGNVDVWSKAGLPESPEVLVFEHSPLVSSSISTAVATVSPTPSITPTPSLTPTTVPTPTPTDTPEGFIGTRRVSGAVFSHVAEPGRELTGTLVRCTSSPSPPCTPRELVTGPDGEFSFDVQLFEHFRISITAEHLGFGPTSSDVSGIGCWDACPELEITLSPRALLPWAQPGVALR